MSARAPFSPEFARAVDVPQVLANGAHIDPEQLGHPPLTEPEGLTLVEDFDAGGTFRRAVEDDLAFEQPRFLGHLALPLNRLEGGNALIPEDEDGVGLQLVVAGEPFVQADHTFRLKVSHRSNEFQSQSLL